MKSVFLASILATTVSFNALAQMTIVDPPMPAAAANHVAAAKKIAGSNPYLQDVVNNGYWCKSPANGLKLILAESRDAVPTLKLFDNLYLIGTGFVGVLVLKTSDGLVIWDTLNNADEVKNILIPGLTALGFNPADIKLAIITHGHGDHYGGAKYLQETYHTPIALSGPDWDLALSRQPSLPNFGPPPSRDRVVTDGEEIKVGDATIRIVLTPGHTPATVGSMLTVKDGGVSKVMALWGGTAYPQKNDDVKLMLASLGHFKEEARKAGAVGLLNTHGFFLNFPQRVAQRGSGPNPLVIGAANVAGHLDVQAECTQAMIAWRAAMPPAS